jgi:hypothetical protein
VKTFDMGTIDDDDADNCQYRYRQEKEQGQALPFFQAGN